jgi:hypothetical protein
MIRKVELAMDLTWWAFGNVETWWASGNVDEMERIPKQGATGSESSRERRHGKLRTRRDAQSSRARSLVNAAAKPK